jgi:hypothetical protein
LIAFHGNKSGGDSPPFLLGPGHRINQTQAMQIAAPVVGATDGCDGQKGRQ